MDAIKDFLKSDRDSSWWNVLINCMLFVAGSAITLFLVVLAELGSTMLGPNTTKWLGICAGLAICFGLLWGYTDYLDWEQRRRHRNYNLN